MMRKLLIFSGAGISADSGIRTFRDTDGLWEDHSIEAVCSAHTWKRNAEIVHAFYNARRQELVNAQPNAAHHMVRRMQERYGVNASIITQNVDDLFEKAGVEDVVHVHGRLSDMRCEACGNLWDIGPRTWDYETERCRCGSRKGVRPGIVMFGDMAPKYALLNRRLAEIRETSGVLVVIGTSGQVVDIGSPAAMMPGMTILSNLESAKGASMPGFPMIEDRQFKKVLHGRAAEMAPVIEEAIIEAMEN